MSAAFPRVFVNGGATVRDMALVSLRDQYLNYPYNFNTLSRRRNDRSDTTETDNFDTSDSSDVGDASDESNIYK